MDCPRRTDCKIQNTKQKKKRMKKRKLLTPEKFKAVKMKRIKKGKRKN